jgi:hypothetical protein
VAARRRRQSDPLAGFEDVSPIEHGSTATVLRARDAVSGARVAIKLLGGVGGGTPDHASFEREVRALGAISRHPNVVSLHRAELTADGRPMLVLELCEGSLARRLTEEGPASVATVLGAAIAVAGALETAHRAGVLHGDVKPENVLVTRYGEYALADFGIAALRAAASGTVDAVPTGASVLHAAPEVLAGEPVTPPSDVYGLASTVVELLTGAAPFAGPGDAEQVRRRVLTEPVPPLTDPSVPPALRDLVVRALAKDPADRPATPLEFAQELRTIERAAGWGPSPCRVGGMQDTWGSSRGSGTVAPQPGRAAAMTGLPPLDLRQLGAPPPRTPPRADPSAPSWGAPDPAVARAGVPPPEPTSPRPEVAGAPAATGGDAAEPGQAAAEPGEAPAEVGEPPVGATAPDGPVEPDEELNGAPVPLPPLWEDVPRRPLHETITFGQPAPGRVTPADPPPAATRRRRWRRAGGEGDADRS